MPYKAIRSFKVRNEDGSYRITKPGELVPEAAGWKNLKAYVERNWICRADEEPSKRHYTAKMRPVDAVLVTAAKPAPAPTPLPEPEPAPEPEASLTETTLSKMTKAKLQDIAEDMGIAIDQTKAELVYEILSRS